jgi:hypothetical protein
MKPENMDWLSVLLVGSKKIDLLQFEIILSKAIDELTRASQHLVLCLPIAMRLPLTLSLGLELSQDNPAKSANRQS